MKKIVSILALAVLLANLVGCSNTDTSKSENTKAANTEVAQVTESAEPITLNIATAGDTNMSELQENEIAPGFTSLHKNVKVNVIGTGAGDAGSMQIYNKLLAQKQANKDTYDIDIAVVHQGIMDELLSAGLLENYVTQTDISSMVVGDPAENSLGTDVKGYVIPLFSSQVAIAYNPDKITEVPTSFEELEAWIKANPGKFGYNGVKNGMSGVAFTTGYVYYKSGDYDKLVKGTYDKSLEAGWPKIMKELKSLPVTYTNGNNGTLDMLNRGEIDMGPVWVDMFYSWQADGRLNPKTKVKLIEPGLPGQPMYIVIPNKAKNKEMAIKYASYLASPETQSKVIVEKYNWYPGIEAEKVIKASSQEVQDKLFSDVTANDLKNNAKAFPLGDYLNDIKTVYEEN